MAQQLYITQSDVKAYLGIPDSNTAPDSFIQLMIPKIMAYIDKYTGRTFGWGNPDDPSDLTPANYKDIIATAGASGEVQDGIYGSKIYLRNTDIVVIDSVKMGNPSIGPQTTLDPTQYLFRNDGRLILGGNWFDSTGFPTAGDPGSFYGLVGGGYQTIYIKYHYGYYGVPEDIAMAALDLFQSMYVSRKAQGLMRERLGDYDIQYDVNFRAALGKQPDTLNILNGYRMPHL